MRVVCVDDSNQADYNGPHLTKGNVYTVIRELKCKEERTSKYIHPPGIYYVLAECGMNMGYLSSMFIHINENQLDETTFERNYSKQVTS